MQAATIDSQPVQARTKFGMHLKQSPKFLNHEKVITSLHIMYRAFRR
jgi:hypothetical protein